MFALEDGQLGENKRIECKLFANLKITILGKTKFPKMLWKTMDVLYLEMRSLPGCLNPIFKYPLSLPTQFP